MANPVRKRKKAARKQARKYKKMSDQERYERIMAAKAKRDVSAKKKSGSVNPKKTINQEKAKAASADIKKKKAVSKENERVVANRKAAAAAKPGQVYTRTMKDGTKKKVKAIKK